LTAQVVPWRLVPGQLITRRKVHDRYGGAPGGRIAPSGQTANILLFSDPEAVPAGCPDHWHGLEFHYTGLGDLGNQEMYGHNAAVRDHRADGRALRLFWGLRGEVQYAGEFEMPHRSAWYKATATDPGTGSERQVIVFRLLPTGAIEPSSSAGPRRLVAPRSPTLVTPYRFEPSPLVDAGPSGAGRALADTVSFRDEVAAAVRAAGSSPLSSGPGDPDFDLAWQRGDGWVVAEVKSFEQADEDHELALGLGQALDHQDTLIRAGFPASPALVVGREPTDERWESVCRQSGVRLVWPGELDRLFV
jgi:hypothetical protein